MTTLAVGHRAAPIVRARPKAPPPPAVSPDIAGSVSFLRCSPEPEKKPAKPVRKPPKFDRKTVPDALDAIVDETCLTLGVSIDSIYGQTRHDRVVLARRLIVACAKKHTIASYPEITFFIRGKPSGHSTAITAHQDFERRMGETINVRGIERTHAEWLYELERRLGLESSNDPAASPC